MKKKAKNKQTKRPAIARRSKAATPSVTTADQLRAVVEGAALKSRLEETVRLEAVREGDSGRTARKMAARLPDRGPVTLRSRDGLASLVSAGSLTEAEAQAGLAFRLCFEAAAVGLRSSMADHSGGGRVQTSALSRDPAALRRAMLMARLNQMERAVGDVIRDGRELHVLRLVAGEGRTIRSIAGGASAGSDTKPAYLASLRRALAAIAAILPGGLANQPR